MIQTNNGDIPNKVFIIENNIDINEKEKFIFEIITNPSLFNKKRTRIISKDKYFSLIRILKEIIEKEFNSFLN